MFYALKTKPNIQRRHDLVGGNKGLSSKKGYLRLIVRLSTANQEWELCNRYRTRSCFKVSIPNRTFNYDRKVAAKTMYLREKETILF